VPAVRGRGDGSPVQARSGSWPLARRSAALPARPRPSSGTGLCSGSSPRRPPGSVAPPAAAPPAAPAAPAAHGGGAAQSRGGFRRGRSSMGTSRGAPHTSSFGSSPSPGPSPSAGSSSGASDPAALIPAAEAPAAGTWPGRACAASRRAQSWNVGQTGNADERQYASWCANARGAGTASAKQRWRWSGRSARSSRSSSNATKGQVDDPSALGSPRSDIGSMIPARDGRPGRSAGV
jgi:hypothetical protein